MLIDRSFPEIANNSDIFHSQFDSSWRVCPVNTVGVMGAGLAKQFKNKIPGLFEYYRKQCEERTFKNVLTFRIEYSHFKKDCVVLFATKRHWANPSRYAYIKDSLDDLKELCLSNKVIYEFQTLVFPEVGCGLGGLDFTVVKGLVHEFSEHVPQTVIWLGRY